ncbi:MAG: SDR family oxidoreductase [Alphaproteobacteria bacterium]|nr:SDR family oxidoreductase [Alphaproteobacteria bacterium]
MSNVQGLMAGKRGVVMGVANDRSIAWGIASALSEAGATLAFTYQDDAFVKRVRPLAESVGAEIVVKCDVEKDDEIQGAVDAVAAQWGQLDFIVHAIAYSDKAGLKGAYLDTTKANFTRTLQISCYSFTAVARAARSVMDSGGSLITLTYLGAERVTPNYNVMGVAKAALESSVRYLANDLGPQGIRVNAISAGPVRTLAGSAIADARFVYRWTADQSPMERNATLEDIGAAGLYLASDLSRGVTGEVHHVDCGFHAIAIPSPDRINARKSEA